EGEVLGVPAREGLPLPGPEETRGVLGERVEEAIAELSLRSRGDEERVLAERRRLLARDLGRELADGRRRVDGEAATEDGEPREEALERGREGAVARVDRGAQRPALGRHVALARHERVDPVAEAREELRRPQLVRAARGELEGEGDPLEPAAELGDGRR